MLKKLTILLGVFFSTTALALNITEQTTPNETMADAQLIEPNNSNPADYYSGQNLNQRVIEGNLDSTTDVDWYRVELDANYMNPVIFINSSIAFNFEIKDSNGITIDFPNGDKYKTYFKNYSYFGAKPYNLSINTPGTYYIKITSIGSTGSYKFGIGKPDYELRTYQYKDAYNYLELRPDKNTDYRGFTIIPNKVAKDAVITMIYFTGTRQGSVSNFSKKLRYGYSTIYFPSYYSLMNIDPNRGLKLDDILNWQIEISGTVRNSYYGYGSNDFKYYPEVKFTYVFPVTVENFNKIDNFK